jgi:hypothetical protein
MCRVLPWLIGIAAPLASAVAQETGGGIRGRVTDAQGLLTPGATATATNRQTAVTRSAVSGTDGTYRLEDLSPGRYRVVVELPGFRSSSIDDVIVVLGRTVDVNVALQPGDVSEVVEVAGDARKQIDIRSSTILMKEAVREFYGADAQPFPPLAADDNVTILGVAFALQSLVVLAIGIVAVAALQLFLNRTRTGRWLDTNDLEPGSVTEGTTRLLENEADVPK